MAFESNLRKKLARIEHVLIVKVSFERRKMAKVFMTLSSVSLHLGYINTSLILSLVCLSTELVSVKVVTHWKVFFQMSLSKVTFERKLARVSWKLSQFFFFRKKLSRLEHVLFLKVSFESYFWKWLSKENFLVCHCLKFKFIDLWYQEKLPATCNMLHLFFCTHPRYHQLCIAFTVWN